LKSVIEITQELIRRPSVTPSEAGCLDFIQEFLEAHQFVCHRLPFDDVDNLYARWGTSGSNFCFAGHVDVVPPGDPSGWIAEPFSGDIIDDILYGRGAVDMKGAIGAFMAAAVDHIQTQSF
jgi:succinyl-diaminopimelate desuccinylase